MTDICWFCNKNTADPTKTIEIGFHKGTENTKVQIPRCSDCAKAQGKAHNSNVLWSIFGPVILLILWVTIGTILNSNSSTITQAFTCIFPFTIPVLWITLPIITNHYLKSMGTVAESNKKKHPEVLKLLKSGYQKGNYSPAKKAQPTKRGASSNEMTNVILKEMEADLASKTKKVQGILVLTRRPLSNSQTLIQQIIDQQRSKGFSISSNFIATVRVNQDLDDQAYIYASIREDFSKFGGTELIDRVVIFPFQASDGNSGKYFILFNRP
jgi:hypothetical protein